MLEFLCCFTCCLADAAQPATHTAEGLADYLQMQQSRGNVPTASSACFSDSCVFNVYSVQLSAHLLSHRGSAVFIHIGMASQPNGSAYYCLNSTPCESKEFGVFSHMTLNRHINYSYMYRFAQRFPHLRQLLTKPLCDLNINLTVELIRLKESRRKIR